MFKKKIYISILLSFLLVSIHIDAQEATASTNSASTTIVLGVSEVSLVKASENIINLQLNQQEAGQSIETSTSDSTSRLLISSVISSDNMRTLTAKITGGSVPSGTHLELTAMQPNPNFVGETGTFTTPVSLDGTDRPFITNISSCYSGTGVTDGYPLRFAYSLDINPATYSALRATSGTQIVVTFTLTAVQ